MLDGLSKEHFEKFLATLDDDRVQAGEKYVALRERLEKFFEWRNCENVSELADIVFDRVAKKIVEGEEIKNAEAYSVTVAKFVLMESRREVLRREELDENSHQENEGEEIESDENEVKVRRLKCLNECLAEFPNDKRKILINYFDTEEKTYISKRKRLAKKLGLNLNSLRIRVCRLKSKLEKCTKECCEKELIL